MSGSIKLILDTSAVLAYAAESQAVIDTIQQVADEGARFGVPLACIAAAIKRTDKSADLLLEAEAVGYHPRCALSAWRDGDVLAVTQLLDGRADLASAAVEAQRRNCSLLTGEAGGYVLGGIVPDRLIA